MKLDHLHLAQFRQFHQPLHIDDLDAGINLFVGPNESGKSTLVDAIRAAFFERHKSGSVDHLQPWGDSSAAPEIELAFEWQGERWVLNKRFLHQKRCDLTVGQQRFTGDDAEDKLAQLMGYTFAGRGASRSELWGIPGLLWVEQGTVQNIQGPASHASEYLQSALGDGLGEVASSGGDALLEGVKKQRAELLTGGGRPTGEYRKVADDLEAHKAALAELDDRVRRYEQQVDELWRLREQQANIDAAKPWEAERAKAEEVEARLQEVQAWQAEQGRDEKALQACAESLDLHRQQLEDLAAGAEQLVAREQARDKAEATLAECEARAPQWEARRDEANTAYEAASATCKQARQQAARKRVQAEHDALAKALQSRKEVLESAQRLQAALKKQRDEQQKTAIDEKLLGELKELHVQFGKLTIQREAVATQLEYDLAAGKSIDIGAHTLTGAGEQSLIRATTLSIPDVGTLRIRPGGTDVSELARQQEQMESDRDDLLGQLAIQTLEEGERRAAEHHALAQAIAEQVAELRGQAPDGVDALAEQYRLDEGRLQELAQQLDTYPEADPKVPEEADAETALDTASDALKAAEQALQGRKTELGIARQARATAAAEWEKLKQELDSPARRQREANASRQLTDRKAEQKQLQSALQARAKQIKAAQPEALALDLERHTKSATAMQQEAADRTKAINNLQIVLETLGAQGLGEKQDAQVQEVAQLARRHDELARRAKALDLLLSLLTDQRQALTRRLQAPLQKHLGHYLQLLFPEAQLSVDENLIPTVLTRHPSGSEERGALEALSYGAREQMGLISRLAYADLLHEADRPTLIILDDALVHSDTERLKRMKRILFDAAQRHQILLFTCHPDHWRDLGVAPRDLQTMKAATA